MKFTADWVKAAMIRALRTAAQTAATMITVGMAANEVDWMNVLSVSAVAAVYSILTSCVTDLPELEKAVLSPDGKLVVDESDPDTYGVFVNFGKQSVEDIAGKQQVVLDVIREKNTTEDDGGKHLASH